MKEIVLISLSEDLEPLLKRSGQVEEERRISEEVMAIHEQVTNIKLTYQEVVSNVTNSILGDRDMEDIELTSTPENKQYSTNDWICSTTTEPVQEKPVVQLPSSTNTINMISGCIPTVTHHQSVHAPTHYHAISCSSTTCMTDGVVTTFDLMPMQHSITKTTPIQSLTSATVHHQHIQPSRESDVMTQSQNLVQEKIDTQLTPILQGITEMLSSLQMDNQNIKMTLNIQQNQIHDIRNMSKTQDNPSDIP